MNHKTIAKFNTQTFNRLQHDSSQHHQDNVQSTSQSARVAVSPERKRSHSAINPAKTNPYTVPDNFDRTFNPPKRLDEYLLNSLTVTVIKTLYTFTNEQFQSFAKTYPIEADKYFTPPIYPCEAIEALGYPNISSNDNETFAEAYDSVPN